MSLAMLVRVREEFRDAVSGKLFDQGARGVEELEDGLRGWFDDPAQADHLRAELELYLDVLEDDAEQRQPWTVKSSIVKDQDWNAAWKSQWSEQRFGRRISVCPSWLEPAELEDGIILRLDPGNAFGTGTHESTALMLEWLDGMEGLAGANVLDAGCGSGILAIAAVKLGADFVYGIDIEVEAIEASRENAKLNGCRVRTHFVQGTPRDLGEPYRFDVVLANIQRSVIEAFFLDLLRATRPGGRIYVAGILKSEEAALLELSTEWKLDPPEIRRKGEWISLCYTRPLDLEL